MTSAEQHQADQKAARFIEHDIIARASTGIQKLPMLDVIFNRLATDLTSVFKARLGLLAEIQMGEVSYSPWGRAMGALDLHCVCAVAAAEPWDGSFILALDPGFFHAACEMQLSGKPSPDSLPKRPPTTIERRMALRMSQVILEEAASNFSRLSEVRFRAEAVETPLQAASIQSASSACAIGRIDIQLGDCAGAIHFILPLPTLEPVSKHLSKMFLGDNLQGDSAWRSQLVSRIDTSSVEIQAQLHQKTVPIADLLAWKPGTVINLGIDQGSELTVTCSGIPILRAAAGNRRNRIALRVTGEHDGSEMPGQGAAGEFAQAGGAA